MRSNLISEPYRKVVVQGIIRERAEELVSQSIYPLKRGILKGPQQNDLKLGKAYGNLRVDGFLRTYVL